MLTAKTECNQHIAAEPDSPSEGPLTKAPKPTKRPLVIDSNSDNDDDVCILLRPKRLNWDKDDSEKINTFFFKNTFTLKVIQVVLAVKILKHFYLIILARNHLEVAAHFTILKL